MRCPKCNESLPFFKGKELICEHCKSHLMSENGKIVHFILIIIFALSLKFVLIGVMDSNIFAGIAVLLFSVLLFQFLANIFINYRPPNE